MSYIHNEYQDFGKSSHGDSSSSGMYQFRTKQNQQQHNQYNLQNQHHRMPSITVSDADDDDVVFMAQPTTTARQGGGSHSHSHHHGSSAIRDNDRRMSDPHGDHPKGRFVAGGQFFNYAAFGSLREGQPAVVLLSSQYFGLAFNAIVAGFTVTFSNCVLQPLLVMALTQSQPEDISIIEKVIQWPGAFSVFMGLFSDCFPIFGYRRKSYMILGWIFAALMYGCITLVDFTMDKTSSTHGYLNVTCAILAFLGYQTAWIASLAMTVEFAQREHLHERGHLQSLYFLLHFTSAALTHVLCAFVVRPTDEGVPVSDFSLASASLVLSGVSLLAVPFSYWFLHEEYALASAASLTMRLRELWNFLQQKVVYRIFVYIVATVFLVNAYSPSAVQYTMLMCGYTPAKDQWLSLVLKAPKIVGVLLFKVFLINVDWRKIGALGVVSYVVCKLALALPVAAGKMRELAYLYMWLGLGEIPQGIFELFIVIPATEIADVGREGVTMGLITSFMILISISTGTLWKQLNTAIGFNIEAEVLVMDEPSTRREITVASLVYAGIQLLSLVMLWLLPAQKLDAQQLRAFGGYNNMARMAIVGAFSALLVYDLVTNILDW